MNGPIAWYHGRYIHRRRVDVLAAHLSQLITKQASVLDVGCGDGLLSAKVGEQRPDLKIQGVDVLVRADASIRVIGFDGETIPLETSSVDVVLLIDVLHHAHQPLELLRETARVARRQIVIKDHFLQGLAAHRTLSMMDRVGNARHGVELPYNYMTPDRWASMFRQIGWDVTESRKRLGLYPPPLNWCFERGLHFIATLEPLP